MVAWWSERWLIYYKVLGSFPATSDYLFTTTSSTSSNLFSVSAVKKSLDLRPGSFMYGLPPYFKTKEPLR